MRSVLAVAALALMAGGVIYWVERTHPPTQDTNTFLRGTVHDPCVQARWGCDRTYGCSEATIDCGVRP